MEARHWSGLPTPSRRTLTTGILPFVRSGVAALPPSLAPLATHAFSIGWAAPPGGMSILRRWMDGLAQRACSEAHALEFGVPGRGRPLPIEPAFTGKRSHGWRSAARDERAEARRAGANARREGNGRPRPTG